MCEPPRVPHHHVELVAVDDEQPAAVGGGMDVGVPHLDAAEVRAEVVAKELVVVARQVDHARAFPRLPQELLRHVVVRLRPIPGAPQPPAVHDVADEVDRLGIVVAQEIEEQVRLAAARSQMHVGDEQGAYVTRRVLRA